MIDRVLEPELMDEPEESEAYNAMDHSVVNAAFAEDFILAAERCDVSMEEATVLDVGTGTALIPIEICRRVSSCRIMANDASVSMLDIARINVAVSGFEHRIKLHHGDSKSLVFQDSSFDCVVSNSLIHHIPEPGAIFREVWRLLRPGGMAFVRDLVRPDSQVAVEVLVGKHASAESLQNQQLLRQSLQAALTVAEVQEILAGMELPQNTVAMTSDRHWTWALAKSR